MLLQILALGLCFANPAYAMFGVGNHLEDRSSAPTRPGSDLEIAATFETPPGHVTISPTGRIFMDAGIFDPAATSVVFEIVNGQKVPFPSPELQKKFSTIHGIYVDTSDRLWILDNNHYGATGQAHVRADDINTGAEVDDYAFPYSVAPLGEMLNDLVVDPRRNQIYIADTGPIFHHSAIIVYDIANRESRRVLAGHPSVTEADNGIFVEGKPFTVVGFVHPKFGIDGIALDPSGQWFYYEAFNSGELYRLPTVALADPAVAEIALEAKVEHVAQITMSDGMFADAQDRIYLTDVEHSAIVRVGADRKLETVFKDPKLRWPTAFSPSPDGYIYLSCNALEDIELRRRDTIVERGPYYLFRFKP
jgi:sugar lactone lactonase YvrE